LVKIPRKPYALEGVFMRKKNLQSTQQSTVFSKNQSESCQKIVKIELNKNADAWLQNYEATILNLIREKEAAQFIDDLMGNNEARNQCIADKAHRKSQELNLSINHEILQMAQFQAFTMAGLQAKAKVLKAVSSPLEFDEGFISHEVNILFTSLLMDTLAGVKQ